MSAELDDEDREDSFYFYYQDGVPPCPKKHFDLTMPGCHAVIMKPMNVDGKNGYIQPFTWKWRSDTREFVLVDFADEMIAKIFRDPETTFEERKDAVMTLVLLRYGGVT